MIVERITTPGLAVHSYLIGDSQTKLCAVIDPVRDTEEIIQTAKSNGLEIIYILETHVHADFVSGSRELKALFNDKPTICCSGMGGKEWTPSYADRVISDGDEIQLGSLKLQAIHTPGHTPEHIMWALYNEKQLVKLFTGDFLFVGDVGRPDLLGKKEMEQLAHQLYNSVFTKLSEIPDSAEIRPAHGAGSMCGKALSRKNFSSMGEERQVNPALQPLPENDWIENLMRGMPPAPSYFSKMKKMNVVGPEIIGQESPGKKALSPQAVKDLMEKGAIPFDLRSKESFAASHISGSINIPFGPQLSTWAGWVLPLDASLILVFEEQEELEPAVAALLRIGFDNIIGYLEGGIWAWEDHGFTFDHLQTQSVMELYEQMQTDKPPLVIDVRTDDEWNAGHIPGAIHIHGGIISKNFEKIPKNRPLSVACGSGFRASIIASLLKRNGFKDITNVFGGMSAWHEKGYPVEKS